jgi:hypothetical protein
VSGNTKGTKKVLPDLAGAHPVVVSNDGLSAPWDYGPEPGWVPGGGPGGTTLNPVLSPEEDDDGDQG